jgi:hypothetical protein
LVAQRELMSGVRQGAAMRPSRWPVRERCRATVVVTNTYGATATIDVNARNEHPTDIAVGIGQIGVTVTPCRQ